MVLAGRAEAPAAEGIANCVTICITHTCTPWIMAILNMRLDDELDRRLAREATLENQTRSELARAAIAEYLEQRERRRFQARILRAARGRGDREAIATAEEALYSDNEALDISEQLAAEPKAAYDARKPRRKKR